MEKRCRLAKAYGWSDDYIRKGITGATGWIYNNWARENENSVWGSSEVRISPGYVKQEYQKRFDELWQQMKSQ